MFTIPKPSTTEIPMTTATTPLASKTLILQNPNHNRAFLNPTARYIRLPQNPSLTLKLRPLTLKPHLRISASSSSQSQSPVIKPNSTFTNSTRTISTFIALAATASAAILTPICQLGLKLKSLCITPTPEEMANLHSLQEALTCTVGPMFFAAIRSRPSGALNTPLTVVAAGLSKWLDIYSGVLLVRVLLSWFPNIPWDRQPLSAIRDLCDPYLNLFRNIIPPIFDTLDVSPLLAFAVLGALSSLLNNSRGV